MGSGGPPRYSRQHMMGGGTGSRVMPGPLRLPKNGVKDVYSVMYNPAAANDLTLFPRGTNSNYTTVAKQAAIGGTLNVGTLTTTWSPGGIGGGPNEPGTSLNVIISGDVSGFNAAYPPTTQSYTDPNGYDLTYTTSISHYRHDTGVYVNLDNRFDAFNIPFGFQKSFNPSVNTIQPPNPSYMVSCGGGGWGSAGGTVYSVAGSTGGAGGAAIKTNGNAVTFTGGQGTDRVFGAIA